MEEYSEFVKTMFQNGFYVEKYSIGLMSYEVVCDNNKIVIVPAPFNDEDAVYVFTGTMQKDKILSGPTEYRLYLEDTSGKEFRDDDLIMMSLIKNDNLANLYTRNYPSWRFGVTFEKGIRLDPEKYIVFQAQKEIGSFDIDITNVDLFRRKNKVEKKEDRMMWIDE